MEPGLRLCERTKSRVFSTTYMRLGLLPFIQNLRHMVCQGSCIFYILSLVLFWVQGLGLFVTLDILQYTPCLVHPSIPLLIWVVLHQLMHRMRSPLGGQVLSCM